MIKEITQQEFDGMDRSSPMMLEIYSKTCGSCQMLSFVLEDIEKSKPDFPIYQIDYDENEELPDRLGVTGFPTMLFFKNGKEVERLVGLKQEPVIAKAIDDLAV
jgi:thioredoxin 1